MTRLLTLSVCLAWTGITLAAEPVNRWTKLENAAIVGRRHDVPLAYSPELDRVLVLGGRTNLADYKQPRSYDVLALDPATGQWENQFPAGSDWGPKVGPCQAPGWKDEKFQFQDSAGNTRPNWTVYGTFSLGQKYGYDSDTKTFYFYAQGKTFRYDPAGREWKNLEPPTNPEGELGGVLLWSSMCYDQHHKRFVLFGGGNIQTPRGDAGTWSYTPATNRWERLPVDLQPPARANSRLVYDPLSKQVVLFGGDRLNELVADTWTLDVLKNEWRRRTPDRWPSPRGGHAMLWLPQAKKVLLVGGYTYTSAIGYVASMYAALPADAWTYDVAADRWERLAVPAATGAPEGSSLAPTPKGPSNFFWSAAVDTRDTVTLLADGVWQLHVDSAKVDSTVEVGQASGTTLRRRGPYDPAWFGQDVPAPDPEKLTKELADLPANTWVKRATPKLPRPNMDWGSAVWAADKDQILRFSGGHSAYSGTAPIVYDVASDRYSIPFAPEFPLEYVYSNDQVHGEWSFAGNPWMTGHTYKATGYDPHSQSLVFAAHKFTYFFDSATGKWTRSTEQNPFRPNMYVVTLCTTPEGTVLWADHLAKSGAGLWRLAEGTRTWRELPLEGPLPGKSADRHGMAYDAKRKRLLFFSSVDKQAGDVAEYDLASGKARWLEAGGRERMASVSARETVYVPELDAVLVGAHVPGADGKTPTNQWPVYDCAKNQWVALEATGDDPVGKRAFNNSMGLMYDAKRKLVWAVGQNSEVYVLRPDAKALRAP